MSQKCQGWIRGEKWPVSSPPDSKIKFQTKEGRASTTSSTNRHKKPDDIILLGAARARTDNRTPKKQLAATVQRQCIFKSSCFCVLPIFYPCHKIQTQQPFLFFYFFFFPHYLALSFLFSRNDFVKSWKKPKHVTMKSLNHWVQTWTCKTKDKRQL